MAPSPSLHPALHAAAASGAATAGKASPLTSILLQRQHQLDRSASSSSSSSSSSARVSCDSPAFFDSAELDAIGHSAGATPQRTPALGPLDYKSKLVKDVFPLDPESPEWTRRVLEGHKRENVPGADGMVRPSLTLLSRNLYYSVFRDWVAQEARRADLAPANTDAAPSQRRNPKRAQNGNSNIMLSEEFPWIYGETDTSKAEVPATVHCTYYDKLVGDWVDIVGYENLARAFTMHVHNTLDPKVIGKKPCTPYQYFPIQRLTEVVEVKDDPRGVTKLVRATAPIAKHQVIGMYEGQWCLQFEHELQSCSTLDRYFTEYKLFDCLENDIPHHLSEQLALEAGVENMSLRRNDANQILTQVWLDGAYSKGYYEWATELNDLRMDPFNRSDEKKRQRKADVLIIDVRIMGWPYKFVVTNRQIPRGKEILIDYGSDYWRLIGQSKRDLDLTQKALQPLESAIPKLTASLPSIGQCLRDLSKDLRTCLSNLSSSAIVTTSTGNRIFSTMDNLMNMVVGTLTMLAPLFVIHDCQQNEEKDLRAHCYPSNSAYTVAQSIADDLFKGPWNRKPSVTKYIEAVEKMFEIIQKVTHGMTTAELEGLRNAYDDEKAHRDSATYRRMEAMVEEEDETDSIDEPISKAGEGRKKQTARKGGSNSLCEHAPVGGGENSPCEFIIDLGDVNPSFDSTSTSPLTLQAEDNKSDLLLDEAFIAAKRTLLLSSDSGDRVINILGEKLFNTPDLIIICEGARIEKNVCDVMASLNSGETTISALIAAKLASLEESAKSFEQGEPIVPVMEPVAVERAESEFSVCDENFSGDEMDFEPWPAPHNAEELVHYTLAQSVLSADNALSGASNLKEEMPKLAHIASVQMASDIIGMAVPKEKNDQPIPPNLPQAEHTGSGMQEHTPSILQTSLDSSSTTDTPVALPSADVLLPAHDLSNLPLNSKTVEYKLMEAPNLHNIAGSLSARDSITTVVSSPTSLQASLQDTAALADTFSSSRPSSPPSNVDEVGQKDLVIPEDAQLVPEAKGVTEGSSDDNGSNDADDTEGVEGAKEILTTNNPIESSKTDTDSVDPQSIISQSSSVNNSRLAGPSSFDDVTPLRDKINDIGSTELSPENTLNKKPRSPVSVVSPSSRGGGDGTRQGEPPSLSFESISDDGPAEPTTSLLMVPPSFRGGGDGIAQAPVPSLPSRAKEIGSNSGTIPILFPSPSEAGPSEQTSRPYATPSNLRIISTAPPAIRMAPRANGANIVTISSSRPPQTQQPPAGTGLPVAPKNVAQNRPVRPMGSSYPPRPVQKPEVIDLTLDNDDAVMILDDPEETPVATNGKGKAPAVENGRGSKTASRATNPRPGDETSRKRSLEALNRPVTMEDEPTAESAKKQKKSAIDYTEVFLLD
ncbi:hypothetical protein DFJ73DRAFT_962317 [Zopfochytrium polystomum]|nr:hypothetical protein DFJ73DRAFT_962317 [Zopfochytrium polystomum]